MRLVTPVACAALALLGGCIVLYNPGSYQIGAGGGGAGGKGPGGAGGQGTSSSGVTATSSSGAGLGGSGGTTSSSSSSGMCPDGGTSSPEVCGNGIDEDCDGKDCDAHQAVWSKRYNDTAGTQQRAVTGVAIANGHIAVAGWYDDGLTLYPNLPIADTNGPGANEAFAVRLDLAGEGADLVVQFIPKAREAHAVAMSADASVVASTGAVTEGTSGRPAFLDHQTVNDTAHSWHTNLQPQGGTMSGTAVAVDASGDVYVAVHTLGTSGSFLCGSTPIPTDSGLATEGVLLAKFASAEPATCLWAQFYRADTIQINALTVDASDAPILAGHYTGTLTASDSTLVLGALGSNLQAGFVVGLSSGAGVKRWAQAFTPLASGGSGQVTFLGLAADDAGTVYVSGSLKGQLSPLESPDSESVLVAALKADLTHHNAQLLWQTIFSVESGGVAQGQGLGVVNVGGTQQVYLAGTTSAGMSVTPGASGGGALCGPGGAVASGGVFLLKLLGETGSPAWGQCFGQGLGTTLPVRLAASAEGLVLGGARLEPISFGQGTLTGNELDGFLARFALP
jgi:hypothetical protein